MKKNLFKSILVFFLMMFAWEAQAQNTTRVYIDDFTIEPGESKELKVKFEGNVYITQVQFTITLPAGLEFENKGTARRPVYVTNTTNSSGLSPSANLIESDNQLIVFMSDGEQIGTEEQSGELAVVYIKAKSDIAGGDYIATLTDVEASDEAASRYVTPNQNIKITVPKQTTQYTVNIQSGNTSYGTVSVSPNGNGTYEEGSVVTATATSKSGYHFVRWSDGNTTNPYRITVKGNVSLTAEFAPESTPGIIEVGGISQMKELPSNTTVKLALNNAVVVHKWISDSGNTQIFLSDNTGACCLFNIGMDLNTGDILNGSITATYMVYNDNPELTTPEFESNIIKTNSTTPHPHSISISVVEGYCCDLVSFSNVSLFGKNTSNYCIEDRAGNNLVVFNGFHYDQYNDLSQFVDYDYNTTIKGILWYYRGKLELYITEIVSSSEITRLGYIENQNEEVTRYTLDGLKVNRSAKGLNIIRMSDGTWKKVVVK